MVVEHVQCCENRVQEFFGLVVTGRSFYACIQLKNVAHFVQLAQSPHFNKAGPIFQTSWRDKENLQIQRSHFP